MLTRKVSAVIAPLLRDAEYLSAECHGQQSKAYTAFARNRLHNYGWEISNRTDAVLRAAKRERIRSQGLREIENRVKQLLSSMNTAREVLRIDREVRARVPELRRKNVEMRTEAVPILSGEVEQLFRVVARKFQYAYERLPRAGDLSETRSCLDELENLVKASQAILERWRKFEAEVEYTRTAMDDVDRAAIVCDPDASDQWNRLQATCIAANEALASGALGRGEALIRQGRKHLSRAREYLFAAIRDAETELDIWKAVLSQTVGLPSGLRSRILAISREGLRQNLQEWEIIKVELEKETDSAAAKTRSTYATVLRTKACQLQWRDPDLEKYKSYARVTRKALARKANTLPTAAQLEQTET